MTDDEIVEAIGLLARTTGYFTETAGGVTIATLAKLARAGAIDPDGCTVAYLTGDGLKTPDAALDVRRAAADRGGHRRRRRGARRSSQLS